MWALTLSVLVLAYLLGAFPTAYIAGRIACGKDIRQMGDGNMGAQNAFRLFGPRIGITVGIIDFLKGIVVVSIAQFADMSMPVILLAGILAVAGHNWPVFLHCRGGRGEATTIGVLFLLVTWPMLIAGLVSLLTLLKTKNVTLASVPLFVLLPFLGWVFHVKGIYIIYGMALPSLVALTHLSRVWRQVPHQV
ncbi:MAG: glycerol-3-phosphate acyltransferase [Dehalococcoidia bacterium]|nr:MAG: glycerol-3-phosphate acyltransferase [Dehalococcoidia bacterium]